MDGSVANLSGLAKKRSGASRPWFPARRPGEPFGETARGRTRLLGAADKPESGR
jgi:hypothetical protein